MGLHALHVTGRLNLFLTFLAMQTSLRRVTSNVLPRIPKQLVLPAAGRSSQFFNRGSSTASPCSLRGPVMVVGRSVGSFANGPFTEDSSVEEKVPAEPEVSNAEVIEELRGAVAELESQLGTVEEKCKETQEKLLRALAENENSRERYRKEVN